MKKLTISLIGLLIAACAAGAIWLTQDNHWILANASQQIDINNCVANGPHSNYLKNSQLERKKISIRVNANSPSGVFVKVQPAFAEVVYYLHINPGDHKDVACSGAHITWSSTTQQAASGTYSIKHH